MAYVDIRSKRFKTEVDMLEFLSGATSTTTIGIAITQAAGASDPEIDTISFTDLVEGDAIQISFAGKNFNYVVLTGDTGADVSTALKGLIDTEISGDPSGPVDDLIEAPAVVGETLVITGKQDNVELEITSQVTPQQYNYVDSKVITTGNRAAAHGVYDSWVLFYSLV